MVIPTCITRHVGRRDIQRHEWLRGHSKTGLNGSLYIYLFCTWCRAMTVEQYD